MYSELKEWRYTENTENVTYPTINWGKILGIY